MAIIWRGMDSKTVRNAKQQETLMSTQTIVLTKNSMTLDELRASIVDEIAGAVGTVVEGTSEDIVAYANDISTSLALAQTLPPGRREAVVKECQQQVVLLAEKNRIRISQTGVETLRSIISLASGVLAGVLAAAGQGLGAAAAGAVSQALGGGTKPGV